VAEAEAAIDRLAGMRVDDFVLCDVLLLRLHALLTRAHGDTATYAHFRDRYRVQGENAWLRGTYCPPAELRVLLAHSMRNGHHQLPRPAGITHLVPVR